MIVLVRAVQTSVACPSQWDAWDSDGNYYYLRYRSGVGYIQRWPGGPEFWERQGEEPEMIARFEFGDEYDGSMELAEFASRAGIKLCEKMTETSFQEHLAQQLGQALKETYPEEWAARFGQEEPQL